MATEKLGIKVERKPPETKLAKLGVKSWPKFRVDWYPAKFSIMISELSKRGGVIYFDRFIFNIFVNLFSSIYCCQTLKKH